MSGWPPDRDPDELLTWAQGEKLLGITEAMREADRRAGLLVAAEDGGPRQPARYRYRDLVAVARRTHTRTRNCHVRTLKGGRLGRRRGLENERSVVLEMIEESAKTSKDSFHDLAHLVEFALEQLDRKPGDEFYCQKTEDENQAVMKKHGLSKAQMKAALGYAAKMVRAEANVMIDVEESVRKEHRDRAYRVLR